jgi:threonine dehydrogenase-like Zn-dependent dehydrogenase
MRAVVADLSVPRYLLTAAAQKLPRGAGKDSGWSRAGVLRLTDEAIDPVLPNAAGWVRLRPELSSICGSDVGLAHAKLSMVLSAYYTEVLQIPGHEFVAVVDQTGPGVTRVQEGDRVAVDVVISCAQRGFSPVCRNCAAGMPNVCERFDQPGVSGCGAPSLGFALVPGGGWAEMVIAHESQCFPIGRMPSTRAVLTEPASVALHAALHWQGGGDRAVVIGPGAIGLLTVAALRRLHPDLDITVLSPNEFGSHWAMKVGATRVLPSGPAAVEALAAEGGGRVLRPKMTTVPLLEQGVDLVVDCVGTPDTIDLGMHIVRAKGMLVLAGTAGRQEVDWSLVWKRELTVQGTTDPGPEPKFGGRRTSEQMVEWLGDPSYPVDGLVTHVFDLADWKAAIGTASKGPAASAVRVAMRPNPELPIVGE